MHDNALYINLQYHVTIIATYPITMKYTEYCFYMYLQINKLKAICNKYKLFIRNNKEMLEIPTKYKAFPDSFCPVHIYY